MRTVLVIKDDQTLREVFRDVLVDEGYCVLVARHGAEGLALLQTVRPDLIAVGGQMPVMDGWEFLARYRGLPGPHVPTIGISVGARALPVDATLPQPFDLDVFLDLVRRYAAAGGREDSGR